MSNDYYCDSFSVEQVSVEVVAETDRVLAFRTWETHIVVIPKSHIRSLADVEDPSLMAELFRVVIEIIRAQELSESNYKVITNGGSYQSNQHLHIHLVSGKPLSLEYPAARGELAV